MICESEMLPRQYVCQAGARSDAWREARMGREGGVEDWLVNSLSQQNWPQEFGLGAITELIVKTLNTKWFRRTA